ncbi:MAG: lipolytic protein [Nitrospirales bacterium]|nr:MAG: lipolytic protein [Nitrospirales bacterium]
MKVICFGDSLTVGYQAPTLATPYYHATPYGEWLQTWLGDAGTVLVRGVNGECTSEMVERFSPDVLAIRPTWVIILGGTNDLGANKSLTHILDNLVTLYEHAVRASIAPVAVTIPSLRSPVDDAGQYIIQPHIERRMELNRRLVDYCQAANIPCIDLFAQTTEENSSLLAARYSNDGIHLSTAGYTLFAQLVWDQLWAKRINKSGRT